MYFKLWMLISSQKLRKTLLSAHGGEAIFTIKFYIQFHNNNIT